MSLSDRRLFLISLGAVALTGCGFTPVYAPGGAAEGVRGAILVDAPETRDAFALVERLETRLGRPSAPRYRLSHTLRTDQEGLRVTDDQETTRYNVTGDLRFRVHDLGTGAVVQSGRIGAFTAYSATGSTVATRAAERDAHDRLMVILADQLVTRLIASAATWPR